MMLEDRKFALELAVKSIGEASTEDVLRRAQVFLDFMSGTAKVVLQPKVVASNG